MANVQANTVEGGNELLNQALVVAQQISLFLPAVGALVAAGTGLVHAIQASAGKNQATVEQARKAVEDWQRAIGLSQQTNQAWLDSHPRT